MTDLMKWMWCILLYVTTTIEAQQTVGDYCSLRNGGRGVCRFLTDCSTAMAVIEVHKPVVCGFLRSAPIVCCGDREDNRGNRDNIRFGDDSLWKPALQQNKPYRPAPLTRVEYPETGSKEKYSETATQSGRNRVPVGHQTVNARNSMTGSKYGETHANRPTATLRKSQMKCKEYSQSVVHKVEALPLLPDAVPVEVEVARCDINKLPLIVGGERTLLGEFPHMAALGYQDGRNIAWNCGGSLISERYVLTAAHCTVTSKGSPVLVRLGELNLKRSDDGAEPRDYTITSIVRHPHYKAPAKYYDIALIRLAQQVQFTKFIRPACLFAEDNFPVNKTIATGWGQIAYAEKQSDVLLKVALDIINNDQCNRMYRSSVGTQALPQGITSSMMCAGVLRGGKDTCHGDSGGPIQISSGQNKCIYYVIGITSFGKFCAAENAPGVYTRVSAFLPWIENEVWP
ncbi:serine protease snake [Anabrus simplex]|uniref:serine protease snake n=1 Tax=Anabrus simplex TaxID=316456 RepID=UPI0035A2A0DE